MRRFLSGWFPAFCAGALMVASGSAMAAGSSSGASKAAFAEQNSVQFSEARALIERLISEEKVPSIAVAVAKDGKILWQEGFGWADRENRIPATAHTPYSLASITKSITATAVMILRERDKIDLDDPIENYLGNLQLRDFAGESEKVTARRVLSHTAGLPLHYYYYHAGYEPPSAEETVARYGIVVYPPGEEYHYSNIGFRLLDVAISNASNDDYSNFIRKEIFVPLGMARSALGLHPAWAEEAAARYDGQHRRIPFYLTDHPGSGDVFASAHDMLRFAMFHLGTPLPDQKRILTPQSIEKMHELNTPPYAIDPYGLGWVPSVDRGFKRVGHGGRQPGVSNEMILYPEEDVAIVVLANQQSNVKAAAEAIAGALLPGYSERGEDQEDPATLAAVEARSRPLPTFTGTWSGTVTAHDGVHPLRLEFQPDGDIHVKFRQQFTTLLNNVGSFGGLLMGRFPGTMPTDDAMRHRHSFLLLLRPQGEELVGQLVAQTLGDPEVFALSSFVRLSHEPEDAGK